MPAGDDDNNNEISARELQERREDFRDAITQVGGGDARLNNPADRRDIVRPDLGRNNEFQFRKTNSVRPFGADRSPNFRTRQIVCQRSKQFLDPINKYYAVGKLNRNQTLSIKDKVTFTPLASSEFYERVGRAPAALIGYALSEEPPNSVNVNFSLGGYQESEGEIIAGIPSLQIQGLDAVEVDNVTNAYTQGPRGLGQVRVNGAGAERGYVFPGSQAGGTDETVYNFLIDINRLATGGQTTVFETLDDALEFFEQTNTVAGGRLTKTIGGVPRRVGNERGGYTDQWQPSPRMERILDELDFDDYDEFSAFANFNRFALEPAGGGSIYDDFDIEFNSEPYAGYARSIHAVLLNVAARLGTDKALRCARAALTRQERTLLTTNQRTTDYEFYDFETQTSFVEDPFTNVLKSNNATRDQVGQNPVPPATIESQYVYPLPGYEDANIIGPVPEPALPNLYVYQLSVGSPGFELGGEGWDSSPEGDELQRGYDRLVTLDEFIQGTLPALVSDEAQLNVERQQRAAQFANYLRAYGEAVQSPEVTIDLTSDIASRYRTMTTDANSMMMYNEYNKYKTEFPMYIELGVPMVTTGTVNTVLLKGMSTTSMVNSVKNVEADSVPFTVNTYGVIAPTAQYLGEERVDSQLRTLEPCSLKGQLKVYDFDEWMEQTVEALGNDNENTDLTLRGPFEPRLGGAALFNNTIRGHVREIQQENMVMYKDFLEGKKTICNSETILFKLVKYASPRANDYRDRQIIQTYYFPNTDGTENRENSSERIARFNIQTDEKDIEHKIINFVDTQIKYDKLYQYELYAYDIVYGSTFKFRTRQAIFPEQGQSLVATNDRQDGLGTLGFYSFNVETVPNTKIVEYPVITYDFKRNKNFNRAAGQEALPITARRPDQQVGGVGYPIVKVVDLPPVPPEASIISFQNQNKVLVNLSPSVGEYIGSNALRYIAFDEEEREVLDELASVQRMNGVTPTAGFMSFKEVRGPVRMLIYRTTEMPTNVANPEDLYTAFSGKLYKTLDPTLTAVERAKARAYDFTDDIEPNTKYYYTFRAQNLKGMISNPTPIYEVELKNDEGFGFSPVIQEYVPVITTSKQKTKKMIRFLEIRASDLQSEPFSEFNQAAGYSNPRTGQFVSQKSLVGQVGLFGITGNNFLVRLTSKDTGRKLNIVIDFDSSENREEDS